VAQREPTSRRGPGAHHTPPLLNPAPDEVVEWRIPASAITLPGPIILELTCTGGAEATRRAPPTPQAQLALDAWAVE